MSNSNLTTPTHVTTTIRYNAQKFLAMSKDDRTRIEKALEAVIDELPDVQVSWVLK